MTACRAALQGLLGVRKACFISDNRSVSVCFFLNFIFLAPRAVIVLQLPGLRPSSSVMTALCVCRSVCVSRICPSLSPSLSVSVSLSL